MISAASLRPDSLKAPVRRVLLTLLVVLVFVLAYGTVLAGYLHQGAALAGPGDRLLVAFPPGTGTPEALVRLGGAGTLVSGTLFSGGGLPTVYRAEVIVPTAGERLAATTWVLRIPRQPTLEGCFNLVTSGE